MRGAAGIIIYRRRGSAIEVGMGTSTSTEDKNRIKTPAARVLATTSLIFSSTEIRARPTRKKSSFNTTVYRGPADQHFDQ